MVNTMTKTNHYSELAKTKTYELYKRVVQSICCFFECPEAFDDYYMELLERLRTDRVVIPEYIYVKFKDYIMSDLNDMFVYPEYVLSKLPTEGKTKEEERVRDKASDELQRAYLERLNEIGREVQEMAMYL